MSNQMITQPGIKNTYFYKSAAAYAIKLRWSVIPLHTIQQGRCTCRRANCDNPGKHPRTVNGVKDATTDMDIIREWAAKWPESNIGIATGSINGFFVLDVDTKNRGDLTLSGLIDDYGELPHTVEAITGSGGSHYLFKLSGAIGNKVGFKPGLDIRGENGFIVAAPSLHISGRAYEWELSSHPLENSIADAPEWLLAMIKQDKKTMRKPSSHWVNAIKGVSEGGRNETASQLIGYLLRKIDPAVAYELVVCWNERNNPPLEIEELDITFNSILRKEVERLKRRGVK